MRVIDEEIPGLWPGGSAEFGSACCRTITEKRGMETERDWNQSNIEYARRNCNTIVRNTVNILTERNTKY